MAESDCKRLKEGKDCGAQGRRVMHWCVTCLARLSDPPTRRGDPDELLQAQLPKGARFIVVRDGRGNTNPMWKPLTRSLPDLHNARTHVDLAKADRKNKGCSVRILVEVPGISEQTPIE